MSFNLKRFTPPHKSSSFQKRRGNILETPVYPYPKLTEIFQTQKQQKASCSVTLSRTDYQFPSPFKRIGAYICSLRPLHGNIKHFVFLNGSPSQTKDGRELILFHKENLVSIYLFVFPLYFSPIFFLFLSQLPQPKSILKRFRRNEETQTPAIRYNDFQQELKMFPNARQLN